MKKVSMHILCFCGASGEHVKKGFFRSFPDFGAARVHVLSILSTFTFSSYLQEVWGSQGTMAEISMTN